MTRLTAKINIHSKYIKLYKLHEIPVNNFYSIIYAFFMFNSQKVES